MNKVKFYIQKTMKKINNFEHLKHYFERLVNEDHFYFVQVLRRKKDDGQPPNFHVIRNYHLFSEKEFEKNWFKWFLTTPFHWFSKRYTRCPYCHGQSYMKPLKK